MEDGIESSYLNFFYKDCQTILNYSYNVW